MLVEGRRRLAGLVAVGALASLLATLPLDTAPVGAQAGGGGASSTTSSTSSTTTTTTVTSTTSTTTTLLPPDPDLPSTEPPALPPPTIPTTGADGTAPVLDAATLAALKAAGDNRSNPGGAPKGLAAILAANKPYEVRLTAAAKGLVLAQAARDKAAAQLERTTAAETAALDRLGAVSGDQRASANRAAAARARVRRLAALAVTSHDDQVAAVLSADSPATARERLTMIESVTRALARAARKWDRESHRLDPDARAAADAAGIATAARQSAEALVATLDQQLTASRAVLDLARAAAGVGPRSVPDIPNRVLIAYLRAAQWSVRVDPTCRMTWWALAAIGRVESGHAGSATVALDGSTYPHIVGIPLDGSRGTAVITDTDGGQFDDDPVHDRAVGPMQFIPSTWRSAGVDASGDGVADPNNIDDAAFAAARYLSAGSRGMPVDTEAGFRAAAFSYNHSAAYVAKVWDGSAAYRAIAAS